MDTSYEHSRHSPGENVKYFAYGSNMNSKRMEEKRVPFLKRRSAKLRGYKLKFNKIATRKTNEGYANIVADLNSIVEGVLYDVRRIRLK